MRFPASCVLMASVAVASASSGWLLAAQSAQGQAAAPQAASRDATPARTGTAVLRGRVVAAATGLAIRRAYVRISSPALREPRTISTDESGRFEFGRLPAGRYTVAVGKNGYVGLEFGQRTPFENGKAIDLADGQTVERLDIFLPRASAIAGTVIDDLGEPAASIWVFALRPQYFEGRRQLVSVGSRTTTDDIGQFRVYGLAPGTYFLRAQPTFSPVSGLDKEALFGDTYYPGSLLAADALPVTVRVGQERLNITIPLVVARMARLSGVASDARGRPLAGGQVNLGQSFRGSGVSFGASAARVEPDGRFTIPNVAPGEWNLRIDSRDPKTDARESARLSVVVTGEDIDGLVLVTSPGATITGRIVCEGDETPAFPPRGVRLYFTELGPMSNIGTSTIREDWSFEVTGVGTGARVLRLLSLPGGWALKAAYAGDDEITDQPLDIRGGRGVSDVRVVITNRPSEVTGTVSDERGQAVTEYTIVVFPTDAARWSFQSRFLASVRSDQHGQYLVSGLPPGEYLAVALDYLEEGQGADPEFLKTIEPVATAFTLADGERKALNLKLTKIESGNER